MDQSTTLLYDCTWGSPGMRMERHEPRAAARAAKQRSVLHHEARASGERHGPHGQPSRRQMVLSSQCCALIGQKGKQFISAGDAKLEVLELGRRPVLEFCSAPLNALICFSNHPWWSWKEGARRSPFISTGRTGASSAACHAGYGALLPAPHLHLFSRCRALQCVTSRRYS